MKKKVMIFGGGTGLSYLLKGLKDFPIDITAVITVSDDGRSTGKLRQEFSTPAVGDIRKVLTSLSELPQEVKDIMEYRFDTYSDLDGHPIGNLVLTAFFTKTKNLKTSIEYLSELLNIKQKVLPLSEDYLTLMAKTTDGEVIEGEDNIGHAHKRFKKIYYKEKPHILNEVIEGIREADLILLSMGSLYTSIIPHLICAEVKKEINKAQAKVMYLCNSMVQEGETDGLAVSDHINELEKYLGKNSIDATIISNTKISKEILEKYADKENKIPIKIDYENLNNKKLEIIESDLSVIENDTIRHDSLKLSSIIFSYLMR